jgi:HAMP domain-containing protein
MPGHAKRRRTGTVGRFNMIFTLRNGVAAITVQGAATRWNANVNLARAVDALQIVGNTVYLGQVRAELAACLGERQLPPPAASRRGVGAPGLPME